MSGQAAPAVTEIAIMDEIDSAWGTSAADIVGQLPRSGDLLITICSPGGSVFEGLAVYSALKRHSGTVGIRVDGLAASIASVICMAASPGQLEVSRGSMMMCHSAWGVCAGDESDMQDMAALLGKASDGIAEIYSSRAGLTPADWREAMRADTWFSAQEAVDAGLADRVA